MRARTVLLTLSPLVLAVVLGALFRSEDRTLTPAESQAEEPRTEGHPEPVGEPRRRRRSSRVAVPPSDPPPPPRETWTGVYSTLIVRVLDPSGAPVAGAVVRTSKFAGDSNLTNARGEAAIPDLTLEPPERIWLRTASGSEPRAWVGDPTVLTLDESRELAIRVVDAITGAALAVADVSVSWDPNGGKQPTMTLPLGFTRGAYRSGRIAVFAGDRFRPEVRLTPLAGYALAPLGGWETTTSRFATRFELTVPLHREARFRMALTDAAGARLPGGEIRCVVLGGRTPLPYRAEPSGSDGIIELRGVPAIEGETVHIRIDGGGVTHWLRDVPLRARESDLTVTVTANEPVWFGGRGSPFGSVPPTLPHGSLEVFVRRNGGTPAAGVQVFIAEHEKQATDEEGRVLFPKAPEGENTVTVLEPGFVPVTRKVAVKAGERARVDLTEPAPRSLLVTVLDHAKRPVPSARLIVLDEYWRPHAPLRPDGVQPLALYTDGNGRCRIPGMPPAGLRIRARYGSRVRTEDAPDSPTLTITLPRPGE